MYLHNIVTRRVLPEVLKEYELFTEGLFSRELSQILIHCHSPGQFPFSLGSLCWLERRMNAQLCGMVCLLTPLRHPGLNPCALAINFSSPARQLSTTCIKTSCYILAPLPLFTQSKFWIIHSGPHNSHPRLQPGTCLPLLSQERNVATSQFG